MRAIPLTAALLVSATVAVSPAFACSKGSFFGPLSGGYAFFTATATPDTVLAGAGTVTFAAGARGGHFGGDGQRSIHGQLVSADRIGGPAASGLPSGVTQVVVVPWDYDPGCRPLPWGRSARFVAPGTRGLYVAELRAQEHWAGGIPTFDLHNPGHLPYTATTRIVGMGADTTVASLLSPDQVFDFYQALPTRGQVEQERWQALGPLRAWVRAHPDQAERAPAERLLWRVLHSLSELDRRETDHPLLGTWRFTLRVPGEPARTFYARTEGHPSTSWGPSRAAEETLRGELGPLPADGYHFLAAITNRMEDLPDLGNGPLRSQAYLVARAAPDSSAGEPTWRGRIETTVLAKAFPGDPRVGDAARVAEQESAARPDGEELREDLPATFARGADGVIRVRQSFPTGNGAELLLEGEQVSRTVTRPRR